MHARDRPHPTAPRPPNAGCTRSYDITDLTRQFLTNVFSDAHELLGKRWTAAQATGRNNAAEITALASLLRGLLKDIDATNGADENFLLGAPGRALLLMAGGRGGG